ncbi:MAG: HAD-IA family hydrolase [Burkholderiaceae bacterium]
MTAARANGRSGDARSAAFDLVVFDWDGTLVDSTGAITEAIRGAASDLSLPIPTREQASHVIGLGLHDALRLAVPDLTAESLPAFVERYRFHYLKRDQSFLPFDGIADLLTELNGSRQWVAIATGKSRVGLNRALEQMGWQRRFITTRCADEGRPKPHPWMLLDICEELGVAPDRAVMIGDTTHDLGMARDAGAASVAVTYGAHPHAELHAFGATVIVDSVAQLRDWLMPRLRAPDEGLAG